MREGWWHKIVWLSYAALAVTILLGGSSVSAQRQGIGEGPVIEEHVSQADIEAGTLTFDHIVAKGQELFTAKFNIFDGQGRPAATGNGTPTKRLPGNAPEFIRTSAPDANSCAGCHNDPRAGGGGDFVVNVFVLAQVLDPVVESVSPLFSNERNTLAMMGSGAIEMLAREMTIDLQTLRQHARDEALARGVTVTKDLGTKGVPFGQIIAHPDGSVDTDAVEGVNADLIIRPFHQKGAVVSLREFTVNAFNHHHGMQAVERFGAARTGTDDFDEDGVPDELTVGDITAATIFQAALNIPGRVMPKDRVTREAIERGEATFIAIGCAECHRPVLILDHPIFSEPNPFNPPGTLRPDEVSRPFTFDLTRQGERPRLERLRDGRAVVRAYTDLKRHKLCDAELTHFCNEQVRQAGIPTELFLTRKLWDVGNSAPYGHRGDLTTITEAIFHHGGEARAPRDAYVALPKSQQDAVVEFLKSLQVLPPGTSSRVGARPTSEP
jgi:Di-haem oxidoreductase, putative peroxidase